MKKLLSLCLLLVAASSLQACTTYVYGPVGDNDGWYHGGWNRGGGWYHGDDRDGFRGGEHGGHRESVASDLSASPAPAADSSATLFARDYSVSTTSAVKILNFAAGTNMSQSLQDLNLSTDEARSIANLNMPSDATVNKVAAALGESSDTVKQIFADFVEQANTAN